MIHQIADPGRRLACSTNACSPCRLGRGEGNVARVAERVGYGSDSTFSTFSTAFRRHVGLPPAQYARQSLLDALETRKVSKISTA